MKNYLNITGLVQAGLQNFFKAEDENDLAFFLKNIKSYNKKN